MAENSKIEWTNSTFNPWRGCTKVAAGCEHCYAETMSKRNPEKLGIWGDKGTRVLASEAMWQDPLKWNQQATDAIFAAEWDKPLPPRPRVFCASLADVFEDWRGEIRNHNGTVLCKHPDTGKMCLAGNARYCESFTMDDARRRLFALIDLTPELNWLLLTKRPENIRRMWPCPLDTDGDGNCHVCSRGRGHYRPNVWLGTSIAEQKDADRNIPELLKCRDLSPVLFVSAEPLLGPIDLSTTCITPSRETMGLDGPYRSEPDAGIDWLIAGGESGPHARPCCLEHIDDLRRQCEAAGVPFFAKQLGAFPVTTNANLWDFADPRLDPWGDFAASGRYRLQDAKGGDWNEWPQELRVRQFPKVTIAATAQ